MSRKSEREARDRANEILRRHASSTRHSPAAEGGSGDEYGAGRLTRDQKKSQAKHIPFTPGPKTTAQKIWRKLV